jgi:ABC-type uncharacterized transport system auxiliary subunit
MKPHSRFMSAISVVALSALVLVMFGCNRSAVRIPGASLSFPETPTEYTAKNSYPYVLVVAPPMDKRSQHYGEKVAGTKWTGCKTDALLGNDPVPIIQQRLVKAFETSGLFSRVSTVPTGPDDVVMKTEIDAFCAESVGFLVIRVAGICALKITLEQRSKVLFERKFERVVTDADKEYTGSQATFLEQAMKVTMADSLRELLKNMLGQIEMESATWKRDN